MPTNYPSFIDSFVNPLASSPPTSPAHHSQHADANDAITAIETKVGVDGSAVTTTIDYFLRNLAIRKDGLRDFAADQSMGGNKLTNVAAPSAPNDAANKGYVDGLVGGGVWTKISDLSAPGTQSLFTFSGISAAYTHLKVIGISRSSATPGGGAGDKLLMRMNNDASGIYFTQFLYSAGGSISPSSFGTTNQCTLGHGSTDSDSVGYANNWEVIIPFYQQTNWTKTFNCRWCFNLSNAGSFWGSSSGVWGSTAAINRLDFFYTTGSFKQNSRFILYGLS